MERLNKDVTSFIANGKTYSLQPLTIGRLRHFRKLERHFAWGQSFEQDYKEMAEIEHFLNKQDWVSAAVTVRQRRERIAYYKEERDEPALLLCTLFFNCDGEDDTVWSEELGHQKIEDWNKEGLDFRDFFTIAGNLVPGLIQHLNETSLRILEGVPIADESLTGNMR